MLLPGCCLIPQRLTYPHRTPTVLSEDKCAKQKLCNRHHTTNGSKGGKKASVEIKPLRSTVVRSISEPMITMETQSATQFIEHLSYRFHIDEFSAPSACWFAWQFLPIHQAELFWKVKSRFSPGNEAASSAGQSMGTHGATLVYYAYIPRKSLRSSEMGCHAL